MKTTPYKSNARALNNLSGSAVALIALTALVVFFVTPAGAGPKPGSHSANKTAPRALGSGLPVPRYVSLKSDRVNIRGGPGLDHRILWIFRRAGLPLEVVKEYQGWRQIRDAEGGTGWVYGAMLSGRRTALVLPWELAKSKKARTELHRASSLSSKTLAFIQAGVLASIVECTGQWCEVSVGNVRGYIEQKKLWGVYPNERLKQ